ncbi:MAG: hypothetical protein KAT05_18020 [Spirochaetes bacterium]|nr:hypothetical protein [Spirochaetota bacterium]
MGDRKKIKLEVSKYQQELGKMVEKEKYLEKLKNKKNYQDIIEKIDGLKTLIGDMTKKIKNTTKQMRKIDQLIANNVKRLDYTQKYFLDILRVACSHIDSNAMKALSRFYKNRRDISIMLDFNKKINYNS